MVQADAADVLMCSRVDRRPSLLALQDYNWYLTTRIPLIVGKPRHPLDHLRKQARSLRLLSDRRRPRWKLLVADLYDHVRVRQQIIIPIRIARPAASGRDHQQAVAIGAVGQRVGA